LEVGSGPTVQDLCGAWVRRSLQLPDGRLDTTTQVTWLQGWQWFIDLRLPGEIPEDVRPETPRANLEAFAGRLVQTCGANAEFTWRRTIDWSPESPPDVGRLSWDGDTLVEEGVLEPYREVWIRAEPHRPNDSVTALLRIGANREAVLLRTARYFGFAVGSPPATSGAGADAEISIGRVIDNHWQVESSTRREMEGSSISILIDERKARAIVATPAGRCCLLSGNWQINEITGDPRLLRTQ